MSVDAAAWVAEVVVDPGVYDRWPEYSVALVAVDHLDRAGLAALADRLVAEAEAAVARTEDPDPHLARWQEAFRSFGVKPRVARNSAEALTRRVAGGGLPRIDVLVDLYNAVSVLCVVPIGGEDLDRYRGPARLMLADGTEPFHTVADGTAVVDHPDPGEPIWVDDLGVTCRRWNWRQTTRTAIRSDTARVGFIVDSLETPAHAGAHRAVDLLVEALPGAVVRWVRGPGTGGR